MRKGITGVLLALALTIGAGSRAQYDRDYFYYVGRSFMIPFPGIQSVKLLHRWLS